jgi:hypothetical protein
VVFEKEEKLSPVLHFRICLEGSSDVHVLVYGTNGNGMKILGQRSTFLFSRKRLNTMKMRLALPFQLRSPFNKPATDAVNEWCVMYDSQNAQAGTGSWPS